jgi:Yersinia/Haemophilus virulence surface antigen
MPTRTIKAYNQSKDGRWYAGEVKPDRLRSGAVEREHFVATDTSEGVCFGLSIWWIIKSARKEPFWSWMVGAGPQVADITGLIRGQLGASKITYVDEKHDARRFEVADKKIRAETKMTRQCELVKNEGVQFDHTAYYYLSLHGMFGSDTEASGHAIAVHFNRDGICRYFDPNSGEYETDTAEEALDDLKNLILGYGITERKIYWCCWR